jgi:hypothetical protein
VAAALIVIRSGSFGSRFSVGCRFLPGSFFPEQSQRNQSTGMGFFLFSHLIHFGHF